MLTLQSTPVAPAWSIGKGHDQVPVDRLRTCRSLVCDRRTQNVYGKTTSDDVSRHSWPVIALPI